MKLAPYSRLLSVIVAVVACGVYLAFGFSEEPPVGTIKGIATMAENGKPLAGVEVTLWPSQDESPGYGQPAKVPDRLKRVARFATTSENGTFEFRNVVAGGYSVDVSGEAHQQSSTSVWVTEGSLATVRAYMDPYAPYLQMHTTKHVFTPDDQAKIEVHGFIKEDSFTVDIYRLNPQLVAKHGGLRSTTESLAHPEYAGEKIAPQDVATKIDSIPCPIEEKDVEGIFTQPVKIPTLKEGLYFVNCGKMYPDACVLLNITKIALVTKSTETSALCFVTDIQTGKPLAGAEVSNGLGSTRRTARTNADGLATLSTEDDESRAGIVASFADSVAVVGLRHYENGEHEGSGQISGYTERPIYRPGDEVNFKAIVRRLDGFEYRLPKEKFADVEIHDPSDTLIEKQRLAITAHGTLTGHFRTSSEAKPGGYTLKIKAGEIRGSFVADLAAYHKPDYTVTVKSLQPYYVLGDRAKVKVSCTYYFGAPVAGAKVSVNVYRSPDWTGYGFDDEDPFQDDGGHYRRFGGGDFAGEKEVVTDAEGNAIVEFETRSKEDPGSYPTNFTYSVSINVTDQGNKSAYAEGLVKVVRGDFNLGLRVDRAVASPTDSIPITVKTMTPGSDAKPVAGRTVTIEVGREVWHDQEVQFVRKATYSAVTGVDGLGHANLDAMKPGSYALHARSRDDRGHVVEASGFVYVSGDKAEIEADAGDISLTIDKHHYDIGDRARLLIQTNQPGGSVLLTVSATEMIHREVIPLDRGAKIVTLPILKDYGPNAYIHVAYVHAGKFMQAEQEIRVDRRDRKFNIHLTTDKAEYLPGQKVHIGVKTTDRAGKPVPAELSLAVVDESIFAVKEDNTDLFAAFYPQRGDSVETSYSFPEIFLDGSDKGGKDVLIRTKFRDTAAWVPFVVTGADGTAKVSIDLPENLTQWRITANGMTDDSRVAQKSIKFLARKPLMVRVLPPTFMVQGDSLHMAVQVVNHSGHDANVNLLVEGSGIHLEHAGRKRVRVANGATEAVDYVADARTSGHAEVTARAWISSGASDGERKGFDVKPHGRLLTENFAGEISGSASFQTRLLPNAPLQEGRLQVTLSPSVASGMAQSLDDLVDFPYGCVEQMLSRFVPAVQVTTLMKGFGLSRPDLDQKIPKIADDGYARLAKMQHPDGGWGWWEHDKSDDFMTAMVLDGIDRAKGAGFPARYVSIHNAVEWLLKSMPTTPWGSDDVRNRLYGAWVLARYGHQIEAATQLEKLKLTPLGPSQNAMAALAYGALGNRFAAKRDEALATLIRMAEVDGPIAHWKEERWSWGEENTALALTALSAHRPHHPLIAKGVAYLMRHREGGEWSSTRASSYVLASLCRYLQTHRPSAEPRQVDLVVNGRTVKTVQFNTASLASPDLTVNVPLSDLQRGQNSVQVRVSGGGTCYYAANLRQYDVRPTLAAVDGDGLKVTRSYYVMKVRALADGTMQLLPSPKPVEEAQPGDILKCVIEIQSKRNREFILIEDPIPSNCRVAERQDVVAEYEQWSEWWCSMVIRDDRVAYFARRLGTSPERLEYTMRVERPGTVRALPTLITNMYDPSQTASSADNRLKVQP